MSPLTHRIFRLGQALGATADRLLRDRCDLGFTDYLLLLGVQTKRGASQAELAQRAGVGDAGASRIVSRLAARGLLTATPDPANRRRSVVSLTPDGRRLLTRASAYLDARFSRRVQTAASRADMAVFERVLDAMASALAPEAAETIKTKP